MVEDEPRLIVATSLVSLLAQSAPRVTTVQLYVFDCGMLAAASQRRTD